MLTPINADIFFHDGRGPELVSAHWTEDGRMLRAIDYYNPGVAHDLQHIHHVEFAGLQVVQITPEEVIGLDMFAGSSGEHSPAAMFDLGKDAWFRTFNPRHLGACSHHQLMFYDELVDVICEHALVRGGGFHL